MDLWIISLEKTEINGNTKENKNNNKIKNKTIQFQWNVELFTLTRLPIKNGSFYIYKNIILTPLDFENILGCDYSDIYTIIDDNDNFLCLTFLLGTIQKMKYILVKMLNSGNYFHSKSYRACESCYSIINEKNRSVFLWWLWNYMWIYYYYFG